MFFIHHLARVGIGFQVGAVGVENPPVSHAAAENLLDNVAKNLLEDVAVIEATDTVLAQGRSVGDFFGEGHAQEPAISDIDLYFLDQTAFAGDTEEIPQQHHFNQANGVNGGSAVVRTVKMGDSLADKFKVDGGINFAHQMVFGDKFIEGDGFKLVLLG